MRSPSDARCVRRAPARPAAVGDGTPGGRCRQAAGPLRDCPRTPAQDPGRDEHLGAHRARLERGRRRRPGSAARAVPGPTERPRLPRGVATPEGSSRGAGRPDHAKNTRVSSNARGSGYWSDVWHEECQRRGAQMNSAVGTLAVAAAWVAAAALGIVTERWWMGVIASVLLTSAAFRTSDWMDGRAAAREATAATEPDYRLVRH